MKYTIKKTLIAASCAGVMFAAMGTAHAKVSAEEAAKLGIEGTELTPFGAIRAGNAEGTIPAWTPEMKVPDGFKSGDRYPDPYADDKPLFTITAENVDKYKDKLTAGQIEMFKTFPETFKMHIYPTHRGTGFSDFAYQSAMKNASRAELAPGGNGIRNAFGGVPFPIPKSGDEAAWNMGTATAAKFFREYNEQVLVYRNGKQSIGGSTNTLYNPYFDPELTLEEYEAGNYQRQILMIETTAPAREKGGSALVYTQTDTGKTPQSAWSYSPGVRRVRRAPTVAYDNFEGLGKFNTVDAGKGFNGATDRYDWKLLGRKELYVPYNAYKFDDPNVSFEELLTAGHANPEYMRYELHRVWEVEATVKEGQRNVFGKRTIHFDEDSWVPVVTDLYDNRGVLWRVVLGNSINRFDWPGVTMRAYMYHDLFSKEYLADTLWNRTEIEPKNFNYKEYSYFKPSTLRKLGVR
ncbi:DUF1329 domain-containing protein [Endozoicomonas sp. OPT23]|uniref:DUF1329 domain-containing protein n=1 Tax=Endozoicomonas sp. OPT23 TaxID=2072845 RepID=UPI00129B0DC2|nr:DUF1329 domain-containing protein [Endozoicomonas sp. OPT23]MRI33837.1 DUF1329 domain-containing protein [Endozoicomonas sp. OPT23]